jgi:ABC-type transport system involved in multi-copper enzyme maturation permease subunit
VKNIYRIILFTLREALSRKIFIIFFAVSTLVIIGFIVGFSLFDLSQFIKMRLGKETEQQIISEILSGIKGMVVGPLFGGGLFLSIFSTAGIISYLLEKGNIDLFLSKPISRLQLILGKFFGGILIVFLNVAYAVVGIWLLIGLKFSNWDLTFLYSILTITFAFAVIYSLIILATVLTRSSVLALVLSYTIFFIISPILAARDRIFEFAHNNALKVIMDVLHYFIPQTSELGTMSTVLAATGKIQDYEPVWTSLCLCILILFVSIIIFNKKDY